MEAIAHTNAIYYPYMGHRLCHTISTLGPYMAHITRFGKGYPVEKKNSVFQKKAISFQLLINQ